MPQEQAREILTFAEFIQSQHQNADNAIASLDNSTPWEELVYSLAGTWAEDFPNLEEIRADLGKDILGGLVLKETSPRNRVSPADGGLRGGRLRGGRLKNTFAEDPN